MVPDLAQEPVPPVLPQGPVRGQDARGLPAGQEDHGADLGSVEPQVEEGVVQLAERPQRPELAPPLAHVPRGRGLPRLGTANREVRHAELGVDLEGHVAVLRPVVPTGGGEGGQRYPGAPARGRGSGQGPGALGHPGREAREGHRLVDQPPLHRPLALDPLPEAREDVGQVAAHVALVHHPGEPAGAGKHPEKRDLREAHRRGGVVHEQDLVAGQGQLVAAPRAGPVHGRQGLEARMLGGVLEGQAGLVRVLAEVDLEGVGGGAQHVDVGPRAEDAVLGAADHEGADLGVLEADTLDRVRQLDVDSQVVAVGLQGIPGPERPVLLDVHDEPGQRGFDLELPVDVPGRMGLEKHGKGGGPGVLHGLPS